MKLELDIILYCAKEKAEARLYRIQNQLIVDIEVPLIYISLNINYFSVFLPGFDIKFLSYKVQTETKSRKIVLIFRYDRSDKIFSSAKKLYAVRHVDTVTLNDFSCFLLADQQ